MAEKTTMQTGGAAASQTGSPPGVKVKEQYDGSFMDQHNHTFKIQIEGQKRKNKITCTEPQSVLEAIKSCETYRELEWSDDMIMIQWGTEDKEVIIATHFPCSCLKDDDILIVSQKTKTVEESQPVRPIFPKDRYSVFYIDTEGGTNTTSKKLFINNKVTKFKFLCVYGEKDITVQEALKRDGRFAELPNFTLIDNSDPDTVIERHVTIDVLNGKKFKIELPRGINPIESKKPKDPGTSSTKRGVKRGTASAREQQTGDRDSTPGLSGEDTQTVVSRKLQDLVQRSGFRAEDVDLGEVMKLLREQFSDLKKLMESRFPDNSFQEALELKKENFGKIQQDFSEFRTYRKLVEMGQSVCQVVVEGFCKGTGFVLIDNFIMTNGHLFKKCTEGNKLKEGLTAYVLFNYEDPDSDKIKFQVENSYICFSMNNPQQPGSEHSTMVDHHTLDYAILKVQPEGQTCGPSAPAPAEQLEVPPEVPPEIPQGAQTEVPPEVSLTLPPGLLEHFVEMPKDGGACIIGHPDGGVKQIDLTCVIEPERREQAAVDRIHTSNSFDFILFLVNKIQKQGIDRVMMGGSKEKAVMTYNTFMYHGASGSPVFDAQGRVCGLHTAGFYFEKENITGSVLEFAQSLEIIMKDLVKTLTERNDQEPLGKIREVSDTNPFLREVFTSVSGGESNTDSNVPEKTGSS